MSFFFFFFFCEFLIQELYSSGRIFDKSAKLLVLLCVIIHFQIWVLLQVFSYCFIMTPDIFIHPRNTLELMMFFGLQDFRCSAFVSVYTMRIILWEYYSISFLEAIMAIIQYFFSLLHWLETSTIGILMLA